MSRPEEGEHAVADGDDDLAAKIADERVIDLRQHGDDLIAQARAAQRHVLVPVVGDRLLVAEEIVDIDRHETETEQETECLADRADGRVDDGHGVFSGWCRGCRGDWSSAKAGAGERARWTGRPIRGKKAAALGSVGAAARDDAKECWSRPAARSVRRDGPRAGFCRAPAPSTTGACRCRR